MKTLVNAPSSKLLPAAEIAAILATWFTIAALEAAMIAAETTARGAFVYWAALRVALSWTLQLAAPAWIIAAAIGAAALALSALPSGKKPKRRARLAVTATGGIALAIWIHSILGSYSAFKWYPPFLGLAVVFAAAFALGHAEAFAGHGASAARLRLGGMLWPAVGLGGFAAAHFANHRLFVGAYPTLHLAALLWASASLQLVFFSLFARWLRHGGLRPVVVGLAVAAALAAPAAFAPRGIVDNVIETAASSNALGEARLVGRSFDPRQEDVLARPLALEADAAALFAEASRFPRLPEGFRLADYNLLLVTSEATRYDQTSLFDPALGTTPNLASLVTDQGAYSFDRAFAASSGTLHSLSGLLCMTFPSMVRLETWGKAWHGRLDDAEETAPELFARSGYDTFLVSHDHNDALRTTMLGLGSGFASREYVYDSGDGPESAETDTRVARIAVAEIRKRARGDRRFFGWIFFASPHAEYLAHFAEMARDTDLDRYRQELRFMDEKLGHVVSALRETGLLERTIIAVVGDHGEEFGEHGGAYHKTTVYSESAWVPLVVRVPGMGGGRIGAPTSAVYLFPWLALAGPEPLAAAARSRLSEEIGPMMRATGGAVIVELVGHDRMLSSLVYESRKINYNFISGRTELFDTRTDPLEQRNLLGSRPELEAEARAAVDAYRRVRAAKRRYTLVPEYER